MGAKGMIALGVTAIALLIGPGTAWAQEDGAAGDATPVQADPAVAPEQDPATTSESDTTSTVADTPTAPSDSGAAESTDTATTAPVVTQASAETTSVDTESAQPQVEMQTVTKTTETKITKVRESGARCGLANAASAPQGVGPPGPGCTRVDGGKISKDPANPTVLPPINGVTIAIWIVDTPGGPEVHWQILDGTFTGTDAINLKVKGGPDPNGFTCQITNATPTGVCHPPFNPNSGKWYGVSHVDACPGNTETPPDNTPPGGDNGSGGVLGEGDKGGTGKKKGVSAETQNGTSSPSVAASSVGGPAGGLPFTGLAAPWLLLIGLGLIGTGAVTRTRLN
jgi:hypothetical protein